MQTYDVSNVYLTVLLCFEAGVHGYKVGRLHESIENDPYRIKLAGSYR
jgi:hypothetical protein